MYGSGSGTNPPNSRPRRSRQLSSDIVNVSSPSRAIPFDVSDLRLEDEILGSVGAPAAFPDALDSLMSGGLRSSGGLENLISAQQQQRANLASGGSSGCGSRASSSGSGGGYGGGRSWSSADGPPTGYAASHSLPDAPKSPHTLHTSHSGHQLHTSEVLNLGPSMAAEVPTHRRRPSGDSGPPQVHRDRSGSREMVAVTGPPSEEQMGVLASSPCGQQLQIDILSTWGDPYYTGLSALEVFDERGNPIELDEPHRQVTAEPADINVLPEYGHDVRVVANLFDGTFRTCDDAHLWLAPFTPGRKNHIFVDLGAPRTISLVRVWNYNKSRTHSFRGARMLEIKLDGHLIFRGEVNKAPGCLHEVEKAAEPILFTMDNEVLATIDEHDRALFEYEPVAELPSAMRERPPTAERQMQNQQNSERNALRPSDDDVPEAVRSALSRPRTAAFNAMMASCNAGQQQMQQAAIRQQSQQQPQPETLTVNQPPAAASGGGSSVPTVSMLQDYMTHVHPAGRVVSLILVSTWGDPHYVGLNGVQLLKPNGEPIRVSPQQLVAEPPSIATLPQLANDPRTVDKLVDGTNATYDDRHMFLAPFTPGRSNAVRLDLGRTERIAAVRLWNYAKTSTRGVRSFEILIDGNLVYQGTARPAPLRQGSAVAASSDFVQTVLFTDNEDLIRQEAHHVYTNEDLEDGLQIFDNGQKIGGGSNVKPEEVVRPGTSAVGAAPPTARRGARPTGGGIGQPSRGGLHANPQAAMAAAQARSAASLRRPTGGVLPAGSGLGR